MQSINLQRTKILINKIDGVSSIPNFGATILGKKFNSELDEDDGLFLNFSSHNMMFPYLEQSNYSEALKEEEIDSVVLENDNLKATFLPSFGGRLISLYDKKDQKELLYHNSVIKFCNLALRNAWFAGGIEWNCGVPGHSPYTCSQVYSAIDDKEKIYRIYEYERVRKVVYQIDFSLPEKSKFLHCRARVYNPNDEATPMYWWSNVAVRTSGSKKRNIVSADSAFTMDINSYSVKKLPVPMFNGVDITYPTNTSYSIDYFYKVKEKEIPYMSLIDDEGKGLVQFSSSRLKGRKLFVWGEGRGASYWQKKLTGNGDNGYYCEIQAGLAPTQYESIPMPPNTAWEWVELYGAIKIDEKIAHGNYEMANLAVKEFIEKEIKNGYLEDFLTKTHDVAIKPINKIVSYGSSWGYLENERRNKYGKKPLSSHLLFKKTDEEINCWESLLQNKSFGDQEESQAPISYSLQQEWIDLMEKAIIDKDKTNWFTYYQLGCSYLASGKIDKAKNKLQKADSMVQSAYVKYVLSQLYMLKSNKEKMVQYAEEAEKLTDDRYIKIYTAKALFESEKYERLYNYINDVEKDLCDEPRLKLYKAFACVMLDKLEDCERILEENGGLNVPDIQECETTLGELWFRLQEKKAKRKGECFTRNYEELPEKFSFQVNSGNKDI